MPNTDSNNNISMTSDRRGFLKLATGVLAAASGLILGLPFVRTLMWTPKAEKVPFAKVGSLKDFPTGSPVNVKFNSLMHDAFLRQQVLHNAWVIKHSDSEVTVFSPVCPHLGCYFAWNGTTRHFECPCHASVFSVAGKVMGGPAPRSLDPLPHKIQGGELYVSWVRYKPGTPNRIQV
jgi:menaquinol-cytochrome c reductase iron-sulfur subunit